MESIISLRGVAKHYTVRQQHVSALRDFNLDLRRGEFVALMGPSGAGKTSVLNLVGGLDRPDAGEVIVMGTHLERMNSGQLARWRPRHVGFVFQSHNLLGILTAAENVELPLLLTSLSRAARQRRVAACLDQVGLLERADHKPGQLSGGQQQRVGIARAIIAEAPLLLCDEPTADLDRASADDILSLLQALTERGRSILMVTHAAEAAARAHRQIQLAA
ncbi:MAG TPA: ABC transporter ATP-binding protein [Steroidobacteraceae bacterium]|nr:ABC transporter ATP-binding protein [Steroidobacteraceae bacterium]